MTHELSLLADLMRKLFEISAQNGGRRVVAVRLKLGALAHVSADHLIEHFEAAARGTEAEGARVEIVESEDVRDAHALDIVLEEVELED